MDIEWLAIALGDVVWILLAFILGLLSRGAGLPPLVGFLLAGFLLNTLGVVSGEMLSKLADLGITLLLFTVGLKFNVTSLSRPQVWAVTALHTSLVVLVFTLLIWLLAVFSTDSLLKLDWSQALLIAFALSFSSTVFVVKSLEDKGEIKALHGRIAIGILIMQDVLAVVFIAVSSGKWPSVWALSILLLIPLRPLLLILLRRSGHGELLVLFGFLLALGGAEVFELVGLKGDLGALILGVMIAGHRKAEELSKAMLSFKDLFLLGFFLSIGMSGSITVDALLLATVLATLVLIKSALFFALLTRFNLRARTSLLTTINLSNYSEFGLIVIALGSAKGLIDPRWLVVIALALAFSFVFAAVLNRFSDTLYHRYRSYWLSWQSEKRISDEEALDIGDAEIAIVGVGGVGTGAYDTLRKQFDGPIVGIDIDPITARKQRLEGRNVINGDPTDEDFWERVTIGHKLQRVFLALPKYSTNLEVLLRLRATGFTGQVAAIAKFGDEAEGLRQAGADSVFYMYGEAGAGFVAHAMKRGASG